MDGLLLAQDVLGEHSGGGGGFNSRVLGHSYQDYFRYPARPSAAEAAGFHLADKMIADGKLFYVQPFRHLWGKDVCLGGAFPYGGTWVCNTCQRPNLNKDWWKVKVFKDGTAWCCVGVGFEDLQSSDNYAFGETRAEALSNYEKLMLAKDATP